MTESDGIPESTPLTQAQLDARSLLSWIGQGRRKVIAVGGLKGGVGKSTLSMFIALAYARHYGLRVLVVDADPLSQTAWDWWRLAKRKGTPLPFELKVCPSVRVNEVIAEETEGYDVIVIDCGGESSDIFGASVSIANHVLFVTSPRKAEMRRIKSSLDGALSAAKESGRSRDIAAHVVLTRVKNSRISHNDAARDKIRDAGYDLLPAEVPDLVDYEDAMEECPADVGHYLEVVKQMEAAA